MKRTVFLGFILTIFAISACTSSNNFSANLVGASDYSTVAVKDFITLGIITVYAQEIHRAGPLGSNKKVEGSKITFSDLMQEAAKLEADDIINIRIDMNTNYIKSPGDFFKGWTRTYTYTGTALAIKYTDKVETDASDPQLGGLPKTPQQTGAVRTTKEGKIELR